MKIHFVFAPPIIQPKLANTVEGMLPPMGILYLASYLRENLEGIEISATDGLVEGFDRTFLAVKSRRPDVLCVSSLTTTALGAYELINRAKKEIPGLVAIVGGPHASALPEDVLMRSAADVVVIGEGEETLFELVQLLMRTRKLDSRHLEKIRGIAFLDSDNRIHRTPIRPYANLDSIPFPARDLLPREDYRGYYFHKRAPEAPMMFSRGCPADCTFCSNLHWKLSKPFVRVRSPENVVDEMEELYELGYREIQDMSDEFNNNVRSATAVCKEIKNRGLDITWKTCLRAHPLPEEFVEAMAEAGCWLVMLGIESGNPETLEGIKKHITLEQTERACRLLKKYNIKVQGLFMLLNVWEQDGKLEYESVEMTRNTLRFIEKLVNQRLLDYIGWSIATPYPGSELYNIACRHNLIKENLVGNWDGWIRDDPFVMRLPGITDQEMARLKREGSIVRAKCILRSGNFGLKDLGFFAKKAAKVLLTEMSARFERLSLPHRF